MLGQADQELRHDRAGVAAGAVDGVVADPRQQLADMPAAPAQRALQDMAQGRGQVAAGVAVRHREHVDAVELVTGCDHPPGAGDEGATQGGGGDGRGCSGGFGHDGSLPSGAGIRLLRRSIATFRAVPASTL